MDANTVFYTPWLSKSNMLTNCNQLYDQSQLFESFEPGDLVAIKFHSGELGNPNYIRPFFIHHIYQKLKEKGCKPFLTDTTTYYRAQRNNAVDHIQTAIANGFGFAPFIIADGLKGENAIPVQSPDPLLDQVEVAGAIYHADAMIVVSHIKGHPLAGFGGAIKNMGMGCTSKKTKLAQHRLINMTLAIDLCQGCGACMSACRFDIPVIQNNHIVIDHPECMRCPACSNACPQGVIQLHNKSMLGKGLAIAAKGVLSTFKPNKVAYISFAVDITTHCDCLPIPGQFLSPNHGVFCGMNPISMDSAALNCIDETQLNKLHQTCCRTQVEELARLYNQSLVTPNLKTIDC